MCRCERIQQQNVTHDELILRTSKKNGDVYEKIHFREISAARNERICQRHISLTPLVVKNTVYTYMYIISINICICKYERVDICIIYILSSIYTCMPLVVKNTVLHIYIYIISIHKCICIYTRVDMYYIYIY